MQTMNISSWTNFKNLINSKKLLIQYSEDTEYYYIYAPEANALLWQIILTKDNGDDVIDFENNFKTTANKPLEYRSNDGLVKVASAKFVESLGLYLTGEVPQANLVAGTIGYIKYHFDVPYTLSGVAAFWQDANFGDYLDFEVGIYMTPNEEETFIVLNKFTSQFKIMGSGHILLDVPTIKTIPVTLNIGFGETEVYIRIKAVNLGSSASKVIVNLVGWM